MKDNVVKINNGRLVILLALIVTPFMTFFLEIYMLQKLVPSDTPIIEAIDYIFYGGLLLLWVTMVCIVKSGKLMDKWTS